jgi:repressor LexA
MSFSLTPSQRRIALLVAAGEAKQIPVFIPELVRELGLAGESSLTPTLRIMQARGFLEIHGGGKQRAYRVLRLTKQGREALGLAGLPVVGRIAAGLLQEALAQPEEYLDSGDLLPHRNGDFLLRVVGDSMIGDGIREGDLVLLRPGQELRNGEIAAAYVGDAFEATLKHVHFEKNRVRLRASNPEYEDIVVPREAWNGVAGVYRGLVRHVGD